MYQLRLRKIGSQFVLLANTIFPSINLFVRIVAIFLTIKLLLLMHSTNCYLLVPAAGRHVREGLGPRARWSGLLRLSARV